MRSDVLFDSFRFFSIKDDNGGPCHSNRELKLLSLALARIRELRAAGWSDEQIKEDLQAVYPGSIIELEFLVQT